MSIRRPIRSFLLTGLLLAVAAPAALADDASDWELRVLGQWVTTSDDFFAFLDEGPGVYLGLERRLDDRWGVELGLGWNQLEGSESFGSDSGPIRFVNTFDAEQDWIPVSIAGNFHLTPQSRFDVYISGRAGWAFVDDLSTRQYERFDHGPPFGSTEFRYNANLPVADSFFYGLRLGFDLPFGDSGWALSTSVDWTVLELEIDYGSLHFPDAPLPGEATQISLDVDPVTFGVGVSRRF